jgi:hypothetical protein
MPKYVHYLIFVAILLAVINVIPVLGAPAISWEGQANPVTYRYDAWSLCAVSNTTGSVTLTLGTIYSNKPYDYKTAKNATFNYFCWYVSPPAGSYTTTATASDASGTTSATITLVVNKASPSATMSESLSGGQWIYGLDIYAYESNKGDNDVLYKIVINGTVFAQWYGNAGGTYYTSNHSLRFVKNGNWQMQFIAIGGQNYTDYTMQTLTATIAPVWADRKGNPVSSIYSAIPYAYGVLTTPNDGYSSLSNIPVSKFALDIPVPVYVVDWWSTQPYVYVGQKLYIQIRAIANNTGGSVAKLPADFQHVYGYVPWPDGFRTVTFPDLGLMKAGDKITFEVTRYALTVWEKSRSCSCTNTSCSCTFIITCNDSAVTPKLPISYTLSPPNWSLRKGYTITVDGKTSGFTFDHDTSTLVISTSFSQSSLEPGDHVISLTYPIAVSAGAPSPTPSQNVSTGGAPPSPQNVSIGGGGAVGGVPSIPIIPSTPEQGGGAVGGGIVGGIIGGAVGGPAGAVAGAVAGAIVGSTIGELLGSEIGSIIGASGMGGAIIIGALISVVVGAVAGYLGSVIYSGLVGSIGSSLALVASAVLGVIAGILLAIAILFLCVIVPYPYNILLLLLLAVLVLLLLSKKKKKGRKAVAGALALATAIPFVPP